MEAHNQYIDTTQVAGTAPAAAVETVALVLPGISVNAGAQIIIETIAGFNTGATTTSVFARIRRGVTAAGALVGSAFGTVVGAGVAVTIPCQVGDLFNADVANQQYCLTLQQTAGTANGTALFASIQASWISQ